MTLQKLQQKFPNDNITNNTTIIELYRISEQLLEQNRDVEWAIFDNWLSGDIRDGTNDLEPIGKYLN